MILLTIDIGNTNITLGVFEDESILETFRLPSDKELPQEEYEILLHTLFKKYKITACIIASVVDELTRTLKHAADNVFHLNSIVLTNKLNSVDKAIGNNTADAILSGVIRGSACAIEGLIEQCEAELGDRAVIIATGGYSSLISKYMNRQFDFVNPYLTLEGLRFLYELNKTILTKCEK